MLLSCMSKVLIKIVCAGHKHITHAIQVVQAYYNNILYKTTFYFDLILLNKRDQKQPTRLRSCSRGVAGDNLKKSNNSKEAAISRMLRGKQPELGQSIKNNSKNSIEFLFIFVI